MTKLYEPRPARLLGFLSCGFTYCRTCATDAFADSGEVIMTSDDEAGNLVCCCCGRPLTPAPALEREPAHCGEVME